MIHYITPFREDKDIGKAYNQQIEPLPDDSTICVMDGDTMFLQPDWGTYIQQVWDNNPHYDLLGAMTNRVGVKEQLHNGSFSDNMDIRYHIELAEYRREKHISDVKPVDLVAGFLMIFNKEMWSNVGGFTEGTNIADKYFCGGVQQLGGTIGIAKGVYVFHSYRPTQHNLEDAHTNTKHLK